jgi:copper chaperone CopZ
VDDTAADETTSFRFGRVFPIFQIEESEMTGRMSAVFAVAIGVIALAGTVRAAEPAVTTISIPEMHCAGCAKKVTTKLAALKGVVKTEVDMKAKTITVTPKVGSVLSPKELWETVVAGDQEPTKLVGPGGTFTEKPKS